MKRYSKFKESTLKTPSDAPLEWKFRCGALKVIIRARSWFEARERALLVFTQNNNGIQPEHIELIENPYE
jgi:hypothetical protein